MRSIRSPLLRRLAALALAAAASPPAGAFAGLEAGTYRIGWAADRSSFLSLVDGPVGKGMTLAVEEINAAGGIGGKLKIELDIRDMKSDPALGEATVRELVAAGADFIVTTCDVDISLPGVRVAAAAGLPAMSSCGSDAAGPSRIAGNLFFLNLPGTLSQGAAMAEYARRMGYRTAYTLKSGDIGYTHTLAEAFEDRFRELGGAILGASSFSIGDTDYRTAAAAMIGSGADVLMSNTFLPDSIPLLKELERRGNRTPLLLVDGNDAPEIFDAGPQLDLAVLLTHGGDPRPGSPYLRFAAAYEERFGEPPGALLTALGYDLIKVVEAAVLAAESTNGQAVADAMDDLENVVGATGSITYRGNPLGGRGLPKKSYAIVKLDRAKRRFEVLETTFPKKIPPPR